MCHVGLIMNDVLENKTVRKQAQTVTASGLLPPLSVSAVLFAILVLLCAVITVADSIEAKDSGGLRNLKYSSGRELDDIENSDHMTAINYLSDIKKRGGDNFIRLSFYLPASKTERKLSVYTYFSQAVLSLNYSETLNTVDLSNTFSENAHQHIRVKPSDEPVFIDIIIKAVYMPKLSVVVTPPTGAGFLSGQLTVAILSLFSLAAYCVSVIINRKKGYNRPLNLFNGIPLLLFASSAGCQIALFVNSYGLSLMRFSIAGMMLAELILLNLLFIRSHVPDHIRQTSISVGLVGLALILIGQYQAMTIFFIRILGIYFPVSIICFMIYCKYKNSGMKFTFQELLFCSLLFLLHITMTLFFFLGIVLEIFYLPLLVCSAYFVLFGIGTLKTGIQISKANQPDKQGYDTLAGQLNIYKPENLGRLQDLLEIFLRNRSNFTHSRNVSLYTYILCKNSGMTKAQSEMIAQAAYLHDIGKMMLPRRLTTSEQTLTGSEYEEIKKHTIYGYNLFTDKDSDFFRAAAIIAKGHHERYDGNGYFGLSGEQIHIYAQIVSIADVFDATTAERAYKKAWPFEEGFHHIMEGSGSLFSKRYVDVFADSKDEIYKIYCDTRR